MSRVTVKCHIRVYEIEGEEQTGPRDIVLDVMSHWNRNELVKLMVQTDAGPHEITVAGKDLVTAVTNCMRTGGF